MNLFGYLQSYTKDPNVYNCFPFGFWIRVAEIYKHFMDLHMKRLVKTASDSYLYGCFEKQAAFGMVIANHLTEGPAIPCDTSSAYSTLKKLEVIAFTIY